MAASMSRKKRRVPWSLAGWSCSGPGEPFQVSHIIFSLWLEIRHTQEKTSLSRAGIDWSYGRYKPELCIYCKDSWVFSDKLFSALDLRFP